MKTFAVNRHRGILSALGSALLFGASTPLAKLAVSSADPLLIAGLLYLGSGIGLAISRTIRAGPLTKRTETPLSRQISHGSPALHSPGAWPGPRSFCWDC